MTLQSNRLHIGKITARMFFAATIALVFGFYTNLFLWAGTTTFTINLKLGDKGESVMRLQIALNADPQTRVASSGAGSPGLETTYFGLLTKAAVIRFQNVYYTEVLAPVGLTNGTGFFGPSSRAKMNALTSTTAQSTTEDTSNVGFTKNFKVGDEDFEVKGLQKWLNRDSRTIISNSGPGSPGNETTYYGSLTAGAVARFQELYASEILTPVGLTRGSGYFGPSTRAKLNALVSARAQATIIDTSNSISGNGSNNTASGDSTANNSSETAINNGIFDGQEAIDFSDYLSGGASSDEILDSISGNNASAEPLITSIVYEEYDGFSVGTISAYSGSPGQFITVFGKELTSGTKVHFDEIKTITGIASADGKSLTFQIPNITKAPYLVTFTSASGEDALRIIDFAITDQNAIAPEIFSISPSIGTNGTQITIYGSGFTATNNQVEIGEDVVTGISSPDGNSIKVTVNSSLNLPSTGATTGLSYSEWPLLIFVANANGRAEKPEIFVLRN